MAACNTQTALFPDKAYVALGKKDNSGSEIDATTQISSWSESGFGQDTDKDDYFGNATIVVPQPQEDGEVAFDVSITNEQWDQIFWGGTGSDFTSGSDQDLYRVVVSIIDQGSLDPTYSGISGSASGSINGANSYRKIYTEARATTFEPELDVDSYLKGSITFKLTATDACGDGNIRIQTLTSTVGSLSGLGSYCTDATGATVRW